MNIVLMGCPGAGKGTQSAKLEKKYGLTHISTGDVLRGEIASGSALGEKIAQLINRGNLVPDEMIIKMLEKRIDKDDCKNGYLLDGFPRTIFQAQELDQFLQQLNRKITAVFYIDIAQEEVIKRLAGRRVCPSCGGSFNIDLKPPRKSGICDFCGTELVQRKDDNPDTIKERLDVYEKQTKPLADYYEKSGCIARIDGAVSPDKVFEQIENYVSNNVK